MKHKTPKELQIINKTADKIWEMADNEAIFLRYKTRTHLLSKSTMKFLYKIPDPFRTQISRNLARKCDGYCGMHSNETIRTVSLYPVIEWLKQHGNEMKPSDFKVRDKVRIIPRQANGAYTWENPNPYNLGGEAFGCKDGVVKAIDESREEPIFVHRYGDSFGGYWEYAEDLIIR